MYIFESWFPTDENIKDWRIADEGLEGECDVNALLTHRYLRAFSTQIPESIARILKLNSNIDLGPGRKK